MNGIVSDIDGSGNCMKDQNVMTADGDNELKVRRSGSANGSTWYDDGYDGFCYKEK